MTNPKNASSTGLVAKKKNHKMHDTLQRHQGKIALDSELRTRYQSSKKPVSLARQAGNIIWTWPTKLLL
jgi:hypothetical protein